MSNPSPNNMKAKAKFSKDCFPEIAESPGIKQVIDHKSGRHHLPKQYFKNLAILFLLLHQVPLLGVHIVKLQNND